MGNAAAVGTPVEYVAGYGRSRSTVLGMLLGRRKSMIVLGEAHNARRGGAPELLCTCGSKASRCTFWAPVVTVDWKGSSRRQIELMESAFGLIVPRLVLHAWINRIVVSPGMTYADWLQLHLSQASRSGYAGIVDTSKSTRETAARPILYSLVGASVTVQLPTRPIGEVITSVEAAWQRRGKRPSRLLPLRVRATRGLSHLFAAVAAKRAGARFTKLVVERQQELLPYEGDHLVGGNRMKNLDKGST